ncbi:phosphoglucomutase (alpha-D-glucose-1,6-bisphosphate-dependent) [Undibacterium sp. SXout7W]|uniref:phosphoglucomutase (alpha-D-glucose-1,6-bisphosphate-dependent) n=1 Tax=Undibacterium sp. SXout7W TaxID=3413049 RepID=UPI003BF2B5CB
MRTSIHPLAGTLAPVSSLINVATLITAYFALKPDPSILEHRIKFGTSGHRGSACDCSFNETHILAITQAICDFRSFNDINGPLFLGMDTHALSEPACTTAMEVLAANHVDVMLASKDEYTPTPAISLAILSYNKHRDHLTGLADGIVLTPSHNPPRDGGFKYNPPNGGPANQHITKWIENAANQYLDTELAGVLRITYSKAMQANTTYRYNFMDFYVGEMSSVINMNAIRDEQIHIGVDPLGGAGVHYWEAIADRYQLDLTVVNDVIDPRFAFVPLDWDGQIRMDPSSIYVMQGLINMQDKFDIAFACDTDHDRHGIVSKTAGLMPPNHYLSVAIDYLFTHRPHWSGNVGVGKTIVTTQMIDRLTKKFNRRLYEVPVGFKWFVDGLHNGELGFCGEESAGASFLRMDGSVWTTDKDGISAALLAAEMLAVTGDDPGVLYRTLVGELGEYFSERRDASAAKLQKQKLAALSARQIDVSHLGDDRIEKILSHAPANNAAIGGIKIMTTNAWFVARPSGTENTYKIYAESMLGEAHLQQIIHEAQAIVDKAISPTDEET